MNCLALRDHTPSTEYGIRQRLPDPLFVHRPRFPRRMPVEERFQQYVRPCPMSGCHIWIGSVSGDGYGTITVKQQQHAAHRWLWERLNGPLPLGFHVCHRCDVPLCVNPSHLFPGLPQDNSDDMRRKGRHAHGVRCHAAKLDESTVREIRLACAEPGITKAAVARRFGVLPGVVSRLLINTWKHVR